MTLRPRIPRRIAAGKDGRQPPQQLGINRTAPVLGPGIDDQRISCKARLGKENCGDRGPRSAFLYR